MRLSLPSPSALPIQLRIGLGLGLALALAALSGCQTSRPTAVAAAVPASAPSGAARAPEAAPPAAARPAPAVPDGPLASEARWLGEWFASTPVRVAAERDGSVLLTVPMKFAFDDTKADAPKAPLQAVLDKLSQSMKRQPMARLQAASVGPGADVRLTAIRSHLAGRGVANWRVAAAPSTAGTAAGNMYLRLVPPAAGLQQLDDSSLPATGAGRAVPPAASAVAPPGKP